MGKAQFLHRRLFLYQLSNDFDRYVDTRYAIAKKMVNENKDFLNENEVLDTLYFKHRHVRRMSRKCMLAKSAFMIIDHFSIIAHNRGLYLCTFIDYNPYFLQIVSSTQPMAPGRIIRTASLAHTSHKNRRRTSTPKLGRKGLTGMLASPLI